MVEIYNINGQKIIQQKDNKKNAADLTTELSKIIKKIDTQIENRVHDTGYFSNFAENFEKDYVPDFFAKNIALFVQRDLHEEGKAFLGISVLHPTMQKDAWTYIINGNRKELLDYIRNPKFNEELKTTILSLAEDLKKVR